jgi:hypothetical protein
MPTSCHESAGLREPDLDRRGLDRARARGLAAGTDDDHPWRCPRRGSARGRIAARLGYEVEVFEADWRLGRRAGPERNVRMLDTKPDLVLAFWDGQSRGTRHTISEARRRNITVRVVTERTARP